MIIINILLIIIWLAAVPYLTGELVAKLLKLKESARIIYVIGMMSVFAIFQCFAIPMTFMHEKLSILTGIFASIMIVLSLSAAVICRKSISEEWKSLWQKPSRQSLWLIIPVLAVVFQAAVAAYMDIPYYNYDDAWYLGVSTTAVDTNTIMEYNAYTGEAYTKWPTRYILSPFPIFEAVLSTLIRLHPVILAHVVFPLIFIPMAYMVYAAVGNILFPEDRKETCMFVSFICLLNIFANYTWFTPGTFLLVRIWQGKAQLANIILPFIFYLGMKVVLEGDKYKYWIVLFITMLAAVMMTSMGVYLAPLVLGVIVLLYAVRYRKISFILKGICSVSPCILFGMIYLIMR